MQECAGKTGDIHETDERINSGEKNWVPAFAGTTEGFAGTGFGEGPERILLPRREHARILPVRIIALGTLREYWKRHPDAEIPLRSWYAAASRADWKRPADIKDAYRNASFVASSRVVFNIKGNDYRLVVAVHYNRGMMFVRFVGTHGDYDDIDAATI